MSTFIDIHSLHTVPPSNINRDDTGAPKSAIFGGVPRHRVSSQAWKRAIRKDFETYLDPATLGIRTRRIGQVVTKRAQILDPALSVEEVEDRLIAAFAALKWKITPEDLKVDKDTGETAERKTGATSGYLAFLSQHQLDRLAEYLVTTEKTSFSKKDLGAILNTSQSIDIALFGRMIADSAEFNVDAAAQVAHAISVHEGSIESDFYTAVDDEIEDTGEETGAGMIGTIELTSSTLYRYATVNLDALIANLGNGDAGVAAAVAFVRSFINSMPTGKQNSFANRTLPEVTVVRIRTDRPVSFVNGFETPVIAATGTDRRLEATKRLVAEARAIDTAYGTDGIVFDQHVALGNLAEPLESLGTASTVADLLAALEATLPRYVK